MAITFNLLVDTVHSSSVPVLKVFKARSSAFMADSKIILILCVKKTACHTNQMTLTLHFVLCIMLYNVF